MKMLSMDRTTFYAAQASEPMFPKPVVVGKNSKGQPVKRYRKAAVLAYAELIR